MPQFVLRVLKKAIKFCLPLRSKGLENVTMVRKVGCKADPRFRERRIQGGVTALNVVAGAECTVLTLVWCSHS